MTYCFIQVIKVRMETHNLSGPLMRADLTGDESLNPELIKIGFLLL